MATAGKDLNDIEYELLALRSRLMNIPVSSSKNLTAKSNSQYNEYAYDELKKLQEDIGKNIQSLCEMIYAYSESIASRESLINPVFGKDTEKHLLDNLIFTRGFSEDLISTDDEWGGFKIINTFNKNSTQENNV